ncbi:ComEC/Rec2 family competence protein [Longivirga aurantiaca]|uniref:ComEC/Rec2 family competence protein n=1 Tax=Longivirga aurantiaca TaxID=1837743 RepID=A0ABW1T2V2_9ACTN
MTPWVTRPVVAAAAVWASAALVAASAPSGPLPAPALVAVIGSAAAATGLLAWWYGLVEASDLVVVLALVLLSAGVAAWRVGPLLDGPLAIAAAERSFVRAEAVTTGDPRVRDGRTSGSRRTDDAWVVDAALVTATIAGQGRVLDLPVQIITGGDAASAAVAGLLPGTTVELTGRVLPADARRGRAATIVAEQVTVVRGPPPVQVAAGAVRESLRQSVSARSADVRGLLPGLVVGDTAAQGPELEQAMRDSGLAHLTAVSGGNVAVVVAVVVVLGRLVGLRRGGVRLVVVALAVAAYVVVARPQPSVLRAAAMAAVVLVALLLDLRVRPVDVLAAAVVGLVLLDPFLAVSVGFAMSVAATAALIVIAARAAPALRAGPWWSRAARAVGALVVVSAAAQLAVAPLVVGIGGGVPVGGVVANLLAEPAVAPATALGLIAAVVGLVSPAAASVLAVPAGWAVSWIAIVARQTSFVAGSLPWPSGWAGAASISAVIGLAVVGAWLARRHGGPGLRAALAVGAAVAVVVAVAPVPVVVPGALSWPPSGWRAVMCAVGQGDALVLRVGAGEAVVVDTGPDPSLVDRCLRRLGVVRVPLVLLTHFHADHVEGLPGVLRGRAAGVVVTSPLDDPPGEDRRVRRWLGGSGASLRVAAPGDEWQVGSVHLRVVWPTRFIRGQGSDANNASVTVLAEVDGITFALGGDLEEAAQDAVLAETPVIPVDVVKVPHHGSRYQSPAWASAFRPRIALIGVGVDNDYGHPAPDTVAAYQAVGAVVGRTDLDGDLAVVLDDTGALALLRRGT